MRSSQKDDDDVAGEKHLQADKFNDVERNRIFVGLVFYAKRQD